MPLFPDGVGPKKFWWFSGPKCKMLSAIESDWAKKVFYEQPLYLSVCQIVRDTRFYSLSNQMQFARAK